MSLGVASGQASAATSSSRLPTVTVRLAAAFEPPVVPSGSSVVGTDAQPSPGGSTARAASGAAVAARTMPSRKPMDNKYPSRGPTIAGNIEIPRKNRLFRTRPSRRVGDDTGFHPAGKPGPAQ